MKNDAVIAIFMFLWFAFVLDGLAML